MVLIGTLGTMTNWLISPANGLAQAAKDGYLPITISKENKYGVPYKVLVLQGIMVSFMLLAFFLIPSINGSYWFLLDLSTELYIMMYIIMFVSAIVLIFKVKTTKIIPGGKVIALVLSAVGLLACIGVFIIGFVPPDEIHLNTHTSFFLIFFIGLIIMTSPALGLMLYKKMHDRPK